MYDVAVIEDPAAAEASLDPVRARLLAELAEPGSATTLAAGSACPGRRSTTTCATLERHGLIELVEERRKGNVTERVHAGHRRVVRHLARRRSRRSSPIRRAHPTGCPRSGCWRWPPGSSATSARCSSARRRRASASPRSRSTARSASPGGRPGRVRRGAGARPSRALVGRYHDEDGRRGREHRVSSPSIRASRAAWPRPRPARHRRKES